MQGPGGWYLFKATDAHAGGIHAVRGRPAGDRQRAHPAQALRGPGGLARRGPRQGHGDAALTPAVSPGGAVAILRGDRDYRRSPCGTLSSCSPSSPCSSSSMGGAEQRDGLRRRLRGRHRQRGLAVLGVRGHRRSRLRRRPRGGVVRAVRHEPARGASWKPSCSPPTSGCARPRLWPRARRRPSRPPAVDGRGATRAVAEPEAATVVGDGAATVVAGEAATVVSDEAATAVERRSRHDGRVRPRPRRSSPTRRRRGAAPPRGAAGEQTAVTMAGTPSGGRRRAGAARRREHAGRARGGRRRPARSALLSRLPAASVAAARYTRAVMHS